MSHGETHSSGLGELGRPRPRGYDHPSRGDSSVVRLQPDDSAAFLLNCQNSCSEHELPSEGLESGGVGGVHLVGIPITCVVFESCQLDAVKTQKGKLAPYLLDLQEPNSDSLTLLHGHVVPQRVCIGGVRQQE